MEIKYLADIVNNVFKVGYSVRYHDDTVFLEDR